VGWNSECVTDCESGERVDNGDGMEWEEFFGVDGWGWGKHFRGWVGVEMEFSGYEHLYSFPCSGCLFPSRRAYRMLARYMAAALTAFPPFITAKRSQIRRKYCNILTPLPPNRQQIPSPRDMSPSPSDVSLISPWSDATTSRLFA